MTLDIKLMHKLQLVICLMHSSDIFHRNEKCYRPSGLSDTQMLATRDTHPVAEGCTGGPVRTRNANRIGELRLEL